MGYFDEEIIRDFKKAKTNLVILSDAELDLIVKNINKNISFSGSQIAWHLLENSAYLGLTTSQAALKALTGKIKQVAKGCVFIVGDSTDHAYSVNVKDITVALELFSAIPQHTYLTQANHNWIACLSFEGHIDFSNLPPQNT